SFILHFLFSEPDLLLEKIDRISIGQASIEGVDVGKRVLLFYKALLLGTLLFLASFKGLSMLARSTRAPLQAWRPPSFFAFLGMGLIGITLTLDPSDQRVLALSLILFLLSLIHPFFEIRLPFISKLLGRPERLYPLTTGVFLFLFIGSILPDRLAEKGASSERAIFQASTFLFIVLSGILGTLRPFWGTAYRRIKKGFEGLREQQGRWIRSLFLASFIPHFLFINPGLGQYGWNSGGEGSGTLFLLAGITGLFLLPAFFFAFLRMERGLALPSRSFHPSTLIAFIGLVLLLGDLMLGPSGRMSINLASTLFLLSYIPLLTLKWNWPGRKLLTLAHPFLAILLCLSLILLAPTLFLTGADKIGLENGAFLWGIILFLLIISLPLFARTLGIRYRKLFRSLAPLTLAPLLLFLSIEISFLILEHGETQLPPEGLFLGSIALALVLGSLLRKKGREGSSLFLLQKFYAPAGLFAFLLLAFYEPIVQAPSALFETANPANAQLNIFGSGRVPLIDFISSHLLSEELYGILYHALFGFDGGMGFLSYRFLNELLFYGLLFTFLRKVLDSSFFAFLFILVFPFSPFFFVQKLFPAVLAFFLLRGLLFRQGWQDSSLLCSTLFLLLAWRLDTGAGSILASMAFLPLSLFGERKAFRLAPFLKGLAVFGATLFLLLGILFLFRSPGELVSSVQQAYRYFSASQAHGFASLAPKGVHPFPFYLYHVAMPMASVLSSIWIVRSLRKEGESLSHREKFLLHASLFFFLLHLVNFHRGLVRHGFMEYTELFLASSFFLALSLFLFSFGIPRTPLWGYIRYLGLALAVLVPLKYFPFYKESPPLEVALNRPEGFDPPEPASGSKPQHERVKTDSTFKEKHYDDIKAFLDRNLKPEQSFLDLSNSPILYYYTQRKIPSFFCVGLQNSIDEKLQWEELERVDLSDIPVVIRSNYPRTWWDRMDGVRNEVRHYWVAEFIHAHYKPYGVLDGHSIWVRHGFDAKGKPAKADTVNTQATLHRNGKIGAFLNACFERRNWKGMELLDRRSLHQVAPGVHRTKIPEKARASPAIWLQLRTQGKAAVHTVRIQGKKRAIGRERFRTPHGKKEHLIRISEHYRWQTSNPFRLSFRTKGDGKIQSVAFYRDERFSIKEGAPS
ncbi:MAG: hypothetical protein ABEH38_01760, partial [Flavobacteriales bacterium]